MHHRSTTRPPTTDSQRRGKPKTSRSLRSLCALGAIALIAASCGSDASDDADAAESAAPVSEAVSETTVTTSTTAPPTSIGIMMTGTARFTEDPVVGSLEVSDGAADLGCESGTFVDTQSATGIARLLTCESGERTGTITMFLAPDDTAGPGDVNGRWNIDGGTADFSGLKGQGDFSIMIDEENGIGSEVLSGSIEVGPIDETSLG